MSAGITGIGQIAVPVTDIKRATAFYRDVLGLKLLFEAPPELAFFDCGGVRLMLSGPAAGSHSAGLLYFKVPDIDAAFAKLETAGATVEQAPHLVAKLPDHGLWMGFFRDSEGNLAAFMEERR